LIPKLRDLSVEEEIKVAAKNDWVELHGGAGKFNFLDTYHLVTRQKTLDNISSPAGAAGSGSVSLTEKILLSDAIYSYALLCARQENATQATELQRKAAETEEAVKKAAALKTAAAAAAAARPSPATDKAIQDAVQVELRLQFASMEARLVKRFDKSQGNQSAAGRSQNQQHIQSANRQGQDRGSDAGNGKGATPPQPPRNALRAGSGDGGGKATKSQPTFKTNRGGEELQQGAHSGSGKAKHNTSICL
jgi:hypothetical protein